MSNIKFDNEHEGCKEAAKKLHNQSIKHIYIDDSDMNNKLIIQTNDGNKLTIEYDWIYSLQLKTIQD